MGDWEISEESLTTLSRAASMISINSRTELINGEEGGFVIGAPPMATADSKLNNYFSLVKEKCKDSWIFLKSQRLRQEVIRTIMAVLIFIVITSLMMIAQIESDEWFDQYSKWLALSNMKIKSMKAFRDIFAVDPLRDRLFEIVPDWNHMRAFLPDALLSSFIATFVLFNVIWIHRKRIEYQGLVVARRFFWIMSCLYLFRMLTFMATTVPNPIHNCVPKHAQIEDLEEYVKLIGDMASGRVSACTDNIYSGHTTLTVVIVFCFWMYSGLLVLQLYAVLHGMLIIGAILLTRLHYTVDVLIAMFMSAFVFLTFHFLLTIMVDDKLLEIENIDAASGAKAVLANERKALHRVYKDAINRAIWWLDGFDLRLASVERPPLEQEDEEVMEEVKLDPLPVSPTSNV